MGMQFSFDYGSTLDLQANGYKVLNGYYPNTATSLYSHVIEQFDLLVTGSSEADLIGKIRAIELIFEQARGHITGPNGVYFNFAPSSGSTWRARVYDGRVLLDKRLDHNWRSNKAVIRITLERAPAWDGTEVQIPLTNPLGTDNTSGLTVYNPNLHRTATTISFDSGTKRVSDSANGLASFLDGMTVKIYGSTSNDGTYTIADGGQAGYFVVNESLVTEGAGDTVGIDGGPCNYVEIAAADVEGDLPAPVRLEITNSYNDADKVGTVWIGHNVESDPANLVSILEGEDAEGGMVGTVIENATVAGNKYQSVTFSQPNETVLLTWTLSTALLNQIRGRYVRLMARFAGTLSTVLWLRLKVKLDVTTLWDGSLQLMGTAMNQELATLRLPPYLLGAGDLYPLDLVLSGKTDQPTYVMTLDFLQIMILDGWRKLVSKGYNLGYQARLVDDGIDDYLYTDSWSTAGKIGNYVGYGEAIQLHPGKLQRLYFQVAEPDGGGDTLRTLSVKLYYRPRRLTL